MANNYNKQSWNEFVLTNRGSFLQSFEWGEFQERAGRRVFRFCGAKSTPSGVEGPQWQVQFIEMTIPCINKKYWYSPKGPVVKSQTPVPNAQILEDVKRTVGEAARKEGVLFLRIGPEWPMASREALIADGFKLLHYDIEPAQTLILDITKSEDELLAQMHEKWRYNIRLAERKGVQIKFVLSDSPNFEYYFEEFYKLVDSGTSERKGIKHHPKEYYRGQLEIGAKSSLTPLYERGGYPPLVKGGEGGFRAVLFVAEYEGKVIAANIVVFFGNKATYLHGATSSEHREVMAPHLLQWAQIKEAKRRGYGEYDFWGIVNEHTLDKRGSSWEGFTRFKRGFSGREVNYVGYFDYPLNKFWYFMYKLVQKIRR